MAIRETPRRSRSRLTTLALCLIAALACGRDAAELEPVTVEADGSDLWAVSAQGDRELLAADGRGYTAHVAPAGGWVVADVALFSDLQITRVYRRDPDSGSFVEERNASREAWDVVAEKIGFSVDDVQRARTRFVSWHEGEEAFLLEVSGSLADGSEILETVRIVLDRGSSARLHSAN